MTLKTKNTVLPFSNSKLFFQSTRKFTLSVLGLSPEVLCVLECKLSVILDVWRKQHCIHLTSGRPKHDAEQVKGNFCHPHASTIKKALATALTGASYIVDVERINHTVNSGAIKLLTNPPLKTRPVQKSLL